MPLMPMPPEVAMVLLSMPSSNTSLFCHRPPPATNGRLLVTPFTGAEKPDSSPSANGLRPFSGRSTIFLLSITWPRDDVEASTSGAASFTSIDCSTTPGFSTTGSFTVWSTASTSGPDVCYLQDLFTAPDARGQGGEQILQIADV